MAVEEPIEGSPKHPGGRPLAFQTVAELDLAIKLYFDKCDPHIEKHLIATGVTANGQTMFEEREVLTAQKPYTMSGLARAMGIDRRTLLNYKKRDQFFPSIQGAIDRCEEYTEGQLFGPFANGAKFSLNNNFNGDYTPWAEKQVLAGDPEAPLGNPMQGLTASQLRKLAEAQPDDAADSSDSA